MFLLTNSLTVLSGELPFKKGASLSVFLFNYLPPFAFLFELQISLTQCSTCFLVPATVTASPSLRPLILPCSRHNRCRVKKKTRQKNSGLMRRSVNHMFTEKPLVAGAFQRDARFALSEAKQTDCLGNMCAINFVHESSWTATAAAAPAEEDAQSPSGHT